MTYKVDMNLREIKEATDATPYTLSTSDSYYIAYENQALVLPDLAESEGRSFLIKLGSVATNGVTISAAGTDTIEGKGTYTLKTDYDFVELVAGSNTWLVTKESTIRVPVSSLVVSDTLELGQEGGVVLVDSTSSITVTIPPNSTTAFSVGTQIVVVRKNTGGVQIAPGSGVTLNSASSNRFISTQHSAATLVKVATNEWYLFGDLSAS